MKSYVIQIEENGKPDKDNLMTIIKALSKAGIKPDAVGVQKLSPINLQKKS